MAAGGDGTLTETIVHAGYPKAASSTLQLHYFGRHPDIDYLGIFPTGNKGLTSAPQKQTLSIPPDVGDAIHEMISAPASGRHDCQMTEIEIKNALKKVANHAGGHVRRLVYSDESLLSMFSPPLELQFQRLCKVLGHFRVLVVLRDQVSLLRSKYRDRPGDPNDAGRGKSIAPDEWVATLLADSKRTALLDYPAVLARIADVTGRQPEVIFFEDLITDWVNTVCQLSTLIGVDAVWGTEDERSPAIENRGITERYQIARDWLYAFRLKDIMARYRNTWFGKMAIGVLLQGNKQKVIFSQETINSIESLVSVSNARLATYMGRDIESLGYKSATAGED